jgi:RNA polymerase subunit RPABC4/transcription elongation factor Spt4
MFSDWRKVQIPGVTPVGTDPPKLGAHMISEGPSLIEALPEGLQIALNGALAQGEALLIAVKANPREALAVTAERVLTLKEPAITGSGPVEIREVALAAVSNVRAEPRPIGGRLAWDSAQPGTPAYIDFPGMETPKFERVADRLRQLLGGGAVGPSPSAAAPAAARTGRGCPKCQTPIPEGGAWCPSCGLQALDPCWECGRALPEGANFCSFCGTPNSEPAVAACPACKAAVPRGHGYCPACGAQARIVCEECDRPMRREWKHCPACGGTPGDAGGSRQLQEAVAPASLREGGAQLPPSFQGGEAEDLNQQGVAAYQAGDLRTAASHFEAATQADPRNASYFTNLGVAYGELGDDLRAFTAYQRAVELNPRELQAYLNMGYLYNERERATEAREVWEKLIRLAPDSEEADEARENLRNLEEV